ncbi:hypothetical protein NDU88_000236 [Pleurodeles waltl]|uniref:Uncharacterized protein n=1 Tax=Pleurodeles waltl TaxID=8319 RepID=A0AAV7MI27_PLEWA|nr:hypothetical protein NDU88_000236 [Pleurodeles waltl]
MGSSALGCNHQLLHGLLGFGVPSPAPSRGARLWGATTSCFMGCSALGCHHQLLHWLLGFGVPSAAASWAAQLWGAITSCFMGCSALGCHHQLLHGMPDFGARLWGASSEAPLQEVGPCLNANASLQTPPAWEAPEKQGLFIL